MAKKHYVSNSSESVRMFRNNFLESLTKLHYAVPLVFWVPVILFFLYRSIVIGELSIGTTALYFVYGLAFWTLAEYVLHRWVFHYELPGRIGRRIHFIFHGVHHDYPKDRLRLVMPLSASIPMASIIYLLFSLFFPTFHLAGFFAGFLFGYLIYDECHYAIHHANFKSGILKRVKDHHMLHHYSDPHKGFGVSSYFWDIIFGTTFGKKSVSPNKSDQSSSQK